MQIDVKHNDVLYLGKQGENKARTFVFDVAKWQNEYGIGTVALVNQRSQDSSPYPCTITTEESKVYWDVTSSDVQYAGYGKLELRYTVNSVVVKSETWQTLVMEALGQTTTPPQPYQAWVDQVLDAADSVEEAVEHYPYIDETTGNWFAWDVENEQFYDTEVHAQGEQGEAGATGNGIASTVLNADYTLTITYTNGTSTTTSSIRGQAGANGQNGTDGVDGEDGEDGVSPAVTITQISGGHEVKITDKEHPSGQAFNVMNGEDGTETSVKVNGSTISPVNHVVDIGTVLTEHQSLANYPTISAMNSAISSYHDSTKQDVISDISAIRSGASKGATAIQEADMLAYHDSTKQDVIADLSAIRSGASAGSTALQPSAISDMASKTWVNEQGFQSAISDLSTIRSNASTGASLQPDVVLNTSARHTHDNLSVLGRIGIDENGIYYE